MGPALAEGRTRDQRMDVLVSAESAVGLMWCNSSCLSSSACCTAVQGSYSLSLVKSSLHLSQRLHSFASRLRSASDFSVG